MLKKAIERFLIAAWLAKNAEVIPKLNQRLRFELSRHIEAIFDKAQGKSLNKILYPEAHHSIAFQFFSISLSYIPAFLRLGTSLILSIFALAKGKKYPAEPIKRATGDLWDKIAKDLSRLVVFSGYIASFIYTALATIPRAIVFSVTLLIGRIASLFAAAPAHAIHKTFASLHEFFRNVGEYIYPAKALKSVEAANPVHTITEIEGTYTKLLAQIGEAEPKSDTTPAQPYPGSSNVLFAEKQSGNAQPEPHRIATDLKLSL